MYDLGVHFVVSFFAFIRSIKVLHDMLPQHSASGIPYGQFRSEGLFSFVCISYHLFRIT